MGTLHAGAQALAVSGAKGAPEKAKKIRCITAGAVVELPNGFDKVTQFLGELDWFGRRKLPRL